MFNKKLLYCYIIILFLFFYFLAHPIQTKAAVLLLEVNQDEYQVGDIFMVDIKVDSQGEHVNAIQGNIEFDQTMLQIENFSQGNSIFTLWIEQPDYSNNNGKLSFAGGLPNGFEGNSGLIGKIIFKAIEKGQTKIKFLNDSKVLLNDGQATEANLTINKIKLNIKKYSEKSVKDEWMEDVKKDTISPESFKIYVRKNQKIFNNQYFIVFSTTDKQTGVDYYEVKEGKLEWKKAESPYLLKDQTLKQEIHIKAVDKSGNERIEIIYPESSTELIQFKPKLNLAKYGFILVAFIFLCYILIRLFSSKK